MAEALIWSNQHGAWWAPGGVGYTTVIEAAGRYSLADAALIVRDATVGGHLTVDRQGPRGERLTVAPEVLVALPVPASRAAADALEEASNEWGPGVLDDSGKSITTTLRSLASEYRDGTR